MIFLSAKSLKKKKNFPLRILHPAKFYLRSEEYR